MKIKIFEKYFSLIIFQLLIFNIKKISAENFKFVSAGVSYENSSKIQIFEEKFEPRIINGVPAEMKRNEHVASLSMKEDIPNRAEKGHYCGGSLISEDIVLTAAHCFFLMHQIPNNESFEYRPDVFEVVMGVLDHENLTGAQQRDVDRIIPHSDYDNLHITNDIGLVFLLESFELGPNVKLIPIATVADYFAGQEVNILGWGATTTYSGSKILLSANTQIMNKQHCIRMAKSDKNFAPYLEFLKIQTLICIGGNGKGVGGGDSGSPLTINNIQYGVCSAGEFVNSTTEQPAFLSLYTDVTSYKDWLATTSGNKIIFATASGNKIILETQLLLSFYIVSRIFY